MTKDNINKNRKEAAKSMAQFLYDMYKEKQQETGTLPVEDDVLVIPTEEKEPE